MSPAFLAVLLILAVALGRWSTTWERETPDGTDAEYWKQQRDIERARYAEAVTSCRRK